MTLDEILTQYEDLWRKAALEDAKQMNVNPDATGPWRSCAWLAADYYSSSHLIDIAENTRVRWTGPGNILTPGGVHYLSGVMATVNNCGHWSWLDFANKFRDCVEEVQ